MKVKRMETNSRRCDVKANARVNDKYSSAPPVARGSQRVDIDDFIKTYSKGAVIPIELLEKLNQRCLDGYSYAYIPLSTIVELDEKMNKYTEANYKLNKCAELNNKGIEAEKIGDINLAISYYEENILLGVTAHHSYKRLMILYHKNKDYRNEIRVINRALEVFPNYEEYMKRLEKVQNFIN